MRALFDDNRPLAAGEPAPPSWLYHSPEDVIEARALADVAPALARLDAALDRGFHAAGFLAYEAGAAFEPRLRGLPRRDPGLPLLRFGLFRERTPLGRAEVERYLGAQGPGAPAVRGLGAAEDRDGFLAAIARIKDYLAAGDVYQINYTFKYRFRLEGDPWALYRLLRANQRVSHGAFLDCGGFSILSLSPELFLEKTGGLISSRPMKGTARRGVDRAGDDEAARWLSSDEKSRAENLMIVDMIRNDLARVAEPGTVGVPDLFTIERYDTLFQMTSTVSARIGGGRSMAEILGALFPCGSITGAPKIRAMEIIRELEAAPRGVYTGAIGYITPERDFRFNVPIRTLVVRGDGEGEMGVGAGIVADSDPAAEYEECHLKAAFLTGARPPPSLIETLRLAQGRYWLFGHHLDRLEASAAYFAYPCDRDAVSHALERHAGNLDRGSDWRVRLLMGPDGMPHVTSRPIERATRGPTVLPPSGSPSGPVVIAGDRVRSEDRHLYHKTTNRRLFDENFSAARERGAREVLFLNERDEVTEGSRTNLFILEGGRLLTPRRDAGLLAGTLRRALLEEGARTPAGGRVPVAEAAITPDHLRRAERLFIGNAVQGLEAVTLAAG